MPSKKWYFQRRLSLQEFTSRRSSTRFWCIIFASVNKKKAFFIDEFTHSLQLYVVSFGVELTVIAKNLMDAYKI